MTSAVELEQRFSPLEKQAADTLRRARRLPPGSDRNDLRQLASALLWIHAIPPTIHGISILGAGGYFIGKSPKDISFADVIRTIDGPLALAPCVSVTAYHKCDDCVDEATCSIRKVLMAARDATAEVLESRTIAQAAANARKAGWA